MKISQNIIGLGKAGCKLALKFADYGNYNVYLIDSEDWEHTNFLKIPAQKSHESYENNFVEVGDFFANIDGDCLFIMSGAGKISGCSLRILQVLKQAGIEIDILYICASTYASMIAVTADKIAFNVLQEYARSGVFRQLYLADNYILEDMVPDLNLRTYFDQINDFLVRLIHTINVLYNSDPVLDTSSDISPAARISTFGIMDFETNEEKLLYDISNRRNSHYLFAMNGKETYSHILLKKIRQVIHEKNKQYKSTSTYALYPTDYDKNYVYVCANSSQIQEKSNREQNPVINAIISEQLPSIRR